MQEKLKKVIKLIITGILLAITLLPNYASAYTIPATAPNVIYTDAQGVPHVCPYNTSTPDVGLTIRVIPCVRDLVTHATAQLLPLIENFMASAALAAIVLAIAVWGVLLLGGMTGNVSQSGMVLVLKIGAIFYFMNNFGGLYPVLLDSLEDILNVIATPIAITNDPTNHLAIWQGASCPTASNFQASEANIMLMWNIVDCYIDLLIGGLTNPITVSSGIIGFVIVSLFSSSVGMFIALIGFYTLLLILFTIGRAVYIFITAYIAISFMVIISPIFIPTILFASTKDYFDGWVRLLVSFMVQPIFLFAYLVMFLVAFNTTVFHGTHSLYYTIARGDSLVANFKLGDWLISKGVYGEKIINKDNIRIDWKGALAELTSQGTNFKAELTGQQDIQGKRDPSIDFGTGGAAPLNYFETGIPVLTIEWRSLAQAVDTSGAYAAAADEDAKKKLDLEYKLRVFLGFLTAAIVMYVFFSLIEYIPLIGTGVIGDIGFMPTLGSGNIAPPGSGLFRSGRGIE